MRKIYSHTKRSTLAKCPRQYFYEYYAHQVEEAPTERQALLFDSPQSEHKVISSIDVGRVDELKKLSSAFQVAGIILHQLIAQHWQHLDWSSSWFEQQAEKRFDAQTRPTDANGTCLLLERHYEQSDTDETIVEARSRMLNAMRTYFSSPQVTSFVGELLAGDELLVEQKIGGLPKVREFTIMGQVDAVSRREGRTRIVDWKMGRSIGDEDSLQLVLYGWWAVEKFNIPPESISLQRVFLGDGVIESPTELNESLLARGRARLAQDVRCMEELHDYGVRGHLEAFPPCEQEKVCRQCKYQGVCPAVACAIL